VVAHANPADASLVFVVFSRTTYLVPTTGNSSHQGREETATADALETLSTVLGLRYSHCTHDARHCRSLTRGARATYESFGLISLGTRGVRKTMTELLKLGFALYNWLEWDTTTSPVTSITSKVEVVRSVTYLFTVTARGANLQRDGGPHRADSRRLSGCRPCLAQTVLSPPSTSIVPQWAEGKN
jgi:hypothetical protein